MAITTPDIHAIADKITAAGGTPTLAAVRSALGGGSFTTISEAMKEWKSSKQLSAAPIREAAPAVIAERMVDAAAEAWAIALEMANARLKSEREALDGARLEMEKAQAEAGELADQLAADLEAAQVAIQEEREALKTAKVQATQKATEIADLVRQLGEQTDAAHSAAAALAEARARIEQLTGLLHQERTERAAAEKQASAAEQSAAVLMARLEGSEQNRAQAEARAVEADKQADIARQTEQSARIAEQAAQARLESAARELETIRKQAAESRAAAKKAGEEAAELRGRLAVKPEKEKKQAGA